ncbi:MAG: hypothetical protein Q9163_006008 [Psora crenata]
MLGKAHFKLDIIFVPAIGADPKLTWAQPTGSGPYMLHDGGLPDRLGMIAQVHLYDHLTAPERSLEFPPAEARPLSTEQQASMSAFVEAENHVGAYGVEEWANRLLALIRQYRRKEAISHRRIIFICHSTGGAVVKCALIKRSANEPNEIASSTIGVTFFAVPHHGSSVLSAPQYVKAVQHELGLKWQMSQDLRRDFKLLGENPNLELVNQKFAVCMVGVKIYSYAETRDTHLTVLTSDDTGCERPTTIRLCIVDSRSGKLGTSHAPVEDEDVMQLNVTHTELPRFTGQDNQYELYLREIEELVVGYSSEDSATYQRLNHDILTKTKVHIHQFYEDSQSMKILLSEPPLKDFLELGPAEIMNLRIEGRGFDRNIQFVDDVERPKIERQPRFQSRAPALKVTNVEEDEPQTNGTLSAPQTPIPASIHTPRPPTTPTAPEATQGNTLAPNAILRTQPKAAHSLWKRQGTERPQSPQRPVPFKLPNRASDRFKWIHVPFTHSGWVHHVLGTISREKQNYTLHTQLLADKIWISQHNQSRHASPHARFVRHSVNCLRPKGAEMPFNGIPTPCSASDDIQFVLYLPYLHWDSFTNMKQRADVIKRRLDVQATPIPPVPADIISSPSMEHKLIWQCLTLERPLHCRRTLDQYGYPSLLNTSVRDHDQILWKRTRLDAENMPKVRRGSAQNFVEGTARQPTSVSRNHVAKVLMVDQLWLWIVDNETVVTFFPGRENDDHQGYSPSSDVRSLIYQDINGDYASQCHDPFDFAALAVLHAVKALLGHDSDRDATLQVFRIFEEYIGILSERQNRSFKEFRDNQGFENAKDIETETHVDNREDLNALLELRDLEDELTTIEKIIKEQKACIGDMMVQFHDLNIKHAKGLKGIEYLHDINHFLGEHKAQTDSMLKSARAAKQAYKELLDMKQKQANVIEAHLAREQTKVAADQSRTVMIFTIFTIIFLPLSFFASVFGINAKEWSGPQSNLLPLHRIFTYMLTISVAVIIVALLAAFSKVSRKLALTIWHRGASPFVRLYRHRYRRHAGPAGNADMADPEKTAPDAQREREIRRQSVFNWETGWEQRMMS